ncbi:odorant receptor 88a-like [Drosophila biarmipes]|uniref:odorant receptor 88a n=1 Tax=Drosophila biarmipes TaxID=125945 RepID=UPI0007E657BF|nr:odorant receptor 88a [Drosophila biarmipes]XP_043951527.2 odorant receptor 88a-like [Drosophila biarmipes]
MKATKIEEPLRMEDFLRPQLLQRLARLVHFQWERNPEDNRMVNTSKWPFWVSAILNLVFFTCNGWDIIGHLWLGQPTNQNPPVISITIYFSIRGLMLYLKRNAIVEFVNDLDRECPRDLASQLDMQMDHTYRYFWKRFHIVQAYGHVGGLAFCLMPLVLFFLTHEGNGSPVAQQEQLLGGWLPLGVRNDPKFYLFVWLYDFYCTVSGISFFITFDNLFNVMQSHLIMHLNHLARQISVLDPRQSLTNEVQFFSHLKSLVQRQQLLNDFCGRYNEIFKVALLVSNFVGAGSLCFFLFMFSETSDLLIMGQYIIPAFVLVVFTFEICLRGTQLEEASEGLESSLCHQEWYLGSQRYRKFYLIWMQYSQRTQKLGAFGLVEVNMVHFTDIMQLAYRLFTFLKSN